MSSNLSTMPGCAGSMQPIEAWLKKGLTCMDCAWEEYCINYFAIEEKPRLEDMYSPDIPMKEADPQTA